MNKNQKIWIGIIAILVLVAASWGLINFANNSDPVEETPEIQTATVRQGDLEIIASGVGTIVPAAEIDLGFSSGGIIGEIFVRVGDQVEKGDLLAKLSDLSKLEADLATAELEVIIADQDLEELYANAEINAAIAQVALADADLALQDAIYTNQVNQAGFRADDTEYAALYANYLIAQKNYDDAKTRYERNGASLAEDSIVRANLFVALEEAEDQRDAYSIQLHWFDASPSDIDQAILDADVAYATAVLADAEKEWEILKDGPNPYDLILAEANVADKKAKLALAEQDLADATLIAPMSGTVLSVNAEIGELIGTSTLVTIANLDQPLLQIYLDESDFDKFNLDLPVEVIFDALPDEIFTGIVDLVNPVLLTTGGVPTVTGLVKLDESAYEVVQKLPIGSNASVDVISARTENAILVPVEAIRKISEDEYAVFVMEDGETKLKIVEVGLIDITYAEILSGIKVGDIVTTGILEIE
ncbi:MAG: HlyD family efflux transporter periplasmic adaptor subunit [Chloroflexi bacterium]|jgi:HlyD family secretion protein|nr:HlyD family efflux transporter periplasmic adaptor subunit [Chloroflexota bacterium]MBT3669709.1 HlyD family efflux transporter periplasmic adaptor subunit [Chloroflexota bacterium]MBT4002803.1 HlyD family efflux transporter periplasmic adaptor subunit [Chloroflexota bacterium]MBT4305637.1 HlyD family efflux transporter periplasmic adaptor subunit [Chloroflexota bacterium]MBT4533794.1 HlyD family efflux transporter periplasmic adaptor subunit [Chloroflexota bacterium]